ncbi:MAG TPA: hypothetical protein VGD77_16000 [Gemmatimonadaceae bacterium]
MPATFEIDHDARLVRSRAWGVLVDDDLARTQAGVRDDPRFEPDYCQLFDFSGVTDVRLTREGLLALAAHSPYGPTARRAMVVPNDLGYGMARMYQMLSGRDPELFRPFRSVEEAMQWLERPRAALPRPTR